MGKENLVLVNSFYTNSILLRGFIDYLARFFTVHFLDLPGFTRAVPPLAEATLDGYAEFVRRKVEALELDHYIMGGLSFGFLVANHIAPPPPCRGILAIVPYLSSDALRFRPFKKACYSAAVALGSRLPFVSHLWRTGVFQRAAHSYSKYSADRVQIILDEMDGRAFFQTGRLILATREPCPFHDVPYVLVTSMDDETIRNDYTVGVFREHVKRLLVIPTPLDHYPDDLSEEYFSTHLPRELIDRILLYFDNGHEPGGEGAEWTAGRPIGLARTYSHS